jgi:hypothetical protein
MRLLLVRYTSFRPFYLVVFFSILIAHESTVQAWVSTCYHPNAARIHETTTVTFHRWCPNKVLPLAHARKNNERQKHQLVRVGLAAASGEDDTSSSDNQNTENNHKSTGRAGGRKRRKSAKNPRKKEKQSPRSIGMLPAVLLLSGVLLVLLKGILFDNVSGDPSFVYYESSVYESLTYGTDGRVETSRRESFRSNIPSLMEQSTSPAATTIHRI